MYVALCLYELCELELPMFSFVCFIKCLSVSASACAQVRDEDTLIARLGCECITDPQL